MDLFNEPQMWIVPLTLTPDVIAASEGSIGFGPGNDDLGETSANEDSGDMELTGDTGADSLTSLVP